MPYENALNPKTPHVRSVEFQNFAQLGAIKDIIAERVRQDDKWGSQRDLPDLCPVLTNREGGATPQRFAEDLEIPTAERAKSTCRGEWGRILVEEICEAVEAAALQDNEELYTELIQVAAVATAWAEAVAERLRKEGE